ncbi:MAG: amidohydrolase family protein [Candidatus Thorarchaeota archaeon]|jgi:predicted TIM-barrel fold metal-dependent hydrolase
MLVVRAVEDIPERGIRKDDRFQFYVVDAHHHMGQEKGQRNSPPGAYDFYALLWFELQRMAKVLIEEDLLLFEPFEVIPPDLPSRMFASRASWARLNHGWLVDRTIVFPFTDDYSKSESPDIPSFRVSNNKIAGWTTRAPHSSRLIGFGRVDPKDSLSGAPNRPIKEIERAVKVLGLRGLKLHPLAQLFVDEIETDYMKKIMNCAGNLGIPVIMDTRNTRTVLRIHGLVNSMRNSEEYKRALAGLSIILAHCGMSPGDPRLYEVLRDPVFFGETSTLHGKDVPILFQMARERMDSPDVQWSEKLLFGTDYSYLSVQAAELILHLISRDFEGTLGEIQRILGGNALTLAQKPFRTEGGIKRKPRTVIFEKCEPAVIQELEDTILSLLGNGWNVSSLDFMIPPKHTWPQVKSVKDGGYNGVHLDSYIVTLQPKSGGSEIHVWIRMNPGGLLSCTVLGTKGKLILDTAEFATQKLGSKLTGKIREDAQSVQTAQELATSVLGMLS